MAGLALWELKHGDAGTEIYTAATVSKQAGVVIVIAQWKTRSKIEHGDWIEKDVRVKQHEILYRSHKYVQVSKASKMASCTCAKAES